METIRLGSKGDDVKTLQKLLNITSDGIFGKKTEEALIKYQKENGLVADGICGAKTWGKLNVKANPKCVDDCVIYKPLSIHITKSPNRAIKYIAIHFTAGSNSKSGKALSAYNTFVSRDASADFCVDDEDIVQLNPDIDNFYCWAVGDKKHSTNGGKLYGKAMNKNTVSIELCSTCVPATKENVNIANHENWYFTDKVMDNAVKLTKILMKKLNIPLENVVRHYDISGKLCPGIVGWNDYYIYDLKAKKFSKNKNNSKKWEDFKDRLKE